MALNWLQPGFPPVARAERMSDLTFQVPVILPRHERSLARLGSFVEGRHADRRGIPSRGRSLLWPSFNFPNTCTETLAVLKAAATIELFLH